MLAHPTDGRAYATVLRPSVVCNVRIGLLWMNGASYRKTVRRLAYGESNGHVTDDVT